MKTYSNCHSQKVKGGVWTPVYLNVFSKWNLLQTGQAYLDSDDNYGNIWSLSQQAYKEKGLGLTLTRTNQSPNEYIRF